MEPDFFVERTATRKDENNPPESRSIQDWHELEAYVLLAEPGAGKSEAFKREALRSGGAAIYLTARDLLTLGVPARWSPETLLFIDALDERRSDASSSMTSLDEVRKKLNELGRPKFRLSCREADWFSGGLKDLEAVTRNGDVHALWLDPLTESDVIALLSNQGTDRVPDPLQFVMTAKLQSMTAMLSNPLLLLLLVDAVRGGTWPSSRHETYELACKAMASEHNQVRLASTPVAAPLTRDLMDSAGRVLALMLLSDAQAVSLLPYVAGSKLIHLRDLDLSFIRNAEATLACLKTKLFVLESGNYYPRHRSIAEYLGAAAIASLVRSGLPITRVLALMSSADGKLAEPLRGLYAWLALHSVESRPYLLNRDPMALLLYGDVRPFNAVDKQNVLRALYQQGVRFRWFRSENWDSQPFGSLGTADMEDVFRGWLSSVSREPAHQSVIECIADAIKFGEPALALRKELESIVRDSTYENSVRYRCLESWLSKIDVAESDKPKLLLNDLHHGLVDDDEDELTGDLLESLYPIVLNTEEVLGYLRPERRRNFIGNFYMFWASKFLETLPESDLLRAADVLAERCLTTSGGDGVEVVDHNRQIDRLGLRVVERAITTFGTQVDGERLYHWLAVGVDKYGNFSAHEEEAERISLWLQEHPIQRRDAFEAGLKHVPAGSDGKRHFHVVEERMFRSRYPRRWGHWLLEMATSASNEDIAKYCFQEAATSVASPYFKSDLTIEEIEDWVAQNAKFWPLAGDWKLERFFWSLAVYQRDAFHREKKHRAQEEEERGKRQLIFAAHLPALETGSAPPWVLDAAAAAYLSRSRRGASEESPLGCVSTALVIDEMQARRAIAGIEHLLSRSDVPSPEAVFESWSQGKRLYLSRPFSLAAQLETDRDALAWQRWSKPLRSALLAFYFADEEMQPAWYTPLATDDPGLVSQVLMMFARPDMARETNPQLRALTALSKEDAPSSLVRIVIPMLWELMPSTPSGGQLHFFERVILVASRLHLDEKVWAELAETRLSKMGTSREFQIPLLLALARFDPARHGSSLALICEEPSPLAAALANAISNCGEDQIAALCTVPPVVGRLIELLAANTPRERPDDSFDYSSVDRRRESAQMLLRALASNVGESARLELMHLRDAPSLAQWSVHMDYLLFQHARRMNLAAFRPASSSAVVKVLTNGAPLSARDMAELARDHFIQLASKIRYEETNLRRAFFRAPTRPQKVKAKRGVEAGKRKPSASAAEIPRVENDCRDIILHLVNNRLLSLGVQFGREASYLADTRADMQAMGTSDGRRIIVPIEVKKDDHPEVWTAWREQLESRYMTNPDAQATGMYLVLWFGHRTKTAPNGIRPASAQQMASMLDALIPADRQAHIVGLVIDFSA